MERANVFERIAEVAVACKVSVVTGSFDSTLCSHLTAAIKDFAEVNNCAAGSDTVNCTLLDCCIQRTRTRVPMESIHAAGWPERYSSC